MVWPEMEPEELLVADDDELQAAFVHIANFQRLLGGVERQAPGGQVDNPCFHGRAVGAEEAQLGRDLDPGVLALSFGFMNHVGVDGGIHWAIHRCNS